MKLERYIIIQAVVAEDKTLIPLWDERISFEKTEDYGNRVTIGDERKHHYDVVECMYDIKNKTIVSGIELDYYPERTKLDFQKGEEVLYEEGHRVLRKEKIVDIVFEDFEPTYTKGKKMDGWWKSFFKDVQIDPNLLYVIRNWKPLFILSDGTKVEYSHKLYRLKK